VFAILEVFHLLGLILLFGPLLMFALRCFGLSLQKDPILRIAREMIPVSTVGFALMSISGYLMFASAAMKYANNITFQYKMVFYFTAIIVHCLVYLKVRRMREERFQSNGVWMVMGGLLLLLWFSVGVAGRAIAFI